MQSKAAEILHTPLLNKGTAFTKEERDKLGLHGLLPYHTSTIEEQLERSYSHYQKRRTPLGKYDYLAGLLGRNEMLYYQLLHRHSAEMLPIIYTPTVGEAALQYSQNYFQQRGLYLTYPLGDQMEAMVYNHPAQEIDVIVATDGERILGLGDQGIGGMTIPIGKLSLYTLFGGIHPSRTLPVLLDVGTNNKELLHDPLYLGWQHPRVRGADYDQFIERFVRAVQKRYPKALLQWEDFGKDNARRVLDRYQTEILSFNDDIQGTAAVATAALLAAMNEAKAPFKEAKIVIFGAGSAGTGIAEMIVAAMAGEKIASQEAHDRIYLLDVDGLIHHNLPHISDQQRPFVKTAAHLSSWEIRNPSYISLADVVANVHPTALIGVSAQGGAFTEEILRNMAAHTKRPIIFPLSNPTSKAECTPQEAIEWTEGRAIVATGSPFQPVSYQGRTYQIGQCNNVYVFPGIGLGALVAGASQVTDGMFLAAAKTLSQLSPALADPTASLFPPIPEVGTISQAIATAVAKQAIADGVASITASEIAGRIQAKVWEPHYPHYAR
ncbi:MAG: NAD-dependent malic enzyme [Chlamydiota bacterium]|jgi:malate dehydrogenase (oxaloacetate-decarboxylating)